jgi:hypothetical protein
MSKEEIEITFSQWTSLIRALESIAQSLAKIANK